ncbi:MAG: hypothetical protein EOP45_14250, partial [Sphingobacteriaceae bacterium]
MDRKLLKAFRASNNLLDVRLQYTAGRKQLQYKTHLRDSNLNEIKNLDYGYELLHINGEFAKGAHAEMQVSQRLIDKIENRAEKSYSVKTGDIYLGISLLCCLDCHAAIEAVNEVNKKIITDFSVERHILSPIITNLDTEDIEKIGKTSYIAFSRRGNHDIEASKGGWPAPHFINRDRYPRTRHSQKKIYSDDINNLPLYYDIYLKIRKKIEDQVRKRIEDQDSQRKSMNMSDSESSSAGGEDYEYNIDKKEEMNRNLDIVDAIEDPLELTEMMVHQVDKIKDPKVLEAIMKKIQEQYEKLEKNQNKAEFDIELNENAFNKYNDQLYWYQFKDIVYISQNIQKEL